MANYAIELNDAGIVAANAEGEIVGPSPGYAHMDGSALLVGQPAMSRSRLNPRRSLNTFWDGLGTDPLSRPFPEQLTQADLAHRHLQEFVTDLSEWQGEETVPRVLLAIPGSFLTWQLGLLLGISRSAGLAVQGLVDSAVAAAVGKAPGGAVFHLDVQLHRVVWTELDTSAGVSRRRVEENGSVGWVGLVDAWAKDIAAQFLRATRFDPLHNAASEQDLYNEIPGWLETLSRTEVVGIGLSYAGRDYAIDVAMPEGSMVHAVRGGLVMDVEEDFNKGGTDVEK